MDEYNQSGDWQEPEFQEEEFTVTPESKRFSAKMPKTPAERQKTWRERHAEENRTKMRTYMASRRKK